MLLSDAPDRRKPRVTDRANGAVLALLVQAGFIALLLISSRRPAPREELARETILLLHPTKPSTPVTIDARTPQRLPRASAAPPALPAAPVPLPSAPPSGLAGFGKSLFGCAPETYANLPPEERAHCPKPGGDLAAGQPPDLMGRPSRVKNEALWEAELARKKSPVWLPCTGSASTPFGAVPTFDLVCIGIMAVQGKLTNPREWPIYETRKYPAETLYKVQQTYDAWHKDHPAAPPGDAAVSQPDRVESAAAGRP